MLNISQLENDLKPIINDQLLRFPFIMQAYIGANMVNTGLKTRIAPSTNAKIDIVSYLSAKADRNSFQPLRNKL